LTTILIEREAEKGIVEIRSFPDGETYVRIVSDEEIKVFLVCTLDQPDTKLLPLYFWRDRKRIWSQKHLSYCALSSMHGTKLSIEVKVSPQRILFDF
jgi:hypothetical protein